MLLNTRCIIHGSLVGLLFIFGSALGPSCSAAEGETNLVGVMISREISPYIQMAEGLESALTIPICRIFFDTNGHPYTIDPRIQKIKSELFKATVAVGPEALRYVTLHQWQGPVVFGMVLDPEKIVRKGAVPCGVSLNLPYQQQIAAIHRVFPDVRRLGVLFNPANNLEWFEKARETAGTYGMLLTALTVWEQSDISNFFEKDALPVDAVMFIPDRTVISKAVIEFAIKETFLGGIPVIGYNRFFHDSGAALSFAIDYRAIGREVSLQLKAMLRGEPCAVVGPRYKLLLNMRVVNSLGLVLGKELPDELEKD